MMAVTEDVLRRTGISDPFSAQIGILDARRGPLVERSGALAGQQQDIARQNEELIRQRGEAVAPARQAIVDKTASPPPMTAKEEPIPNFERPTMKPEELRESFGMLMAASMLVGAMSRTPFSNSMAAMSGAMDGFVKGDAALVRESLQTFDRNVTAIRERNAEKRREVDAAWKTYEHDLQGLRQQLEQIAAKYDDPLALNAARSKSIGEAQRLVETNLRTIDQTTERLLRDRGNLEVKLSQMEQTKELQLMRIELQRERQAQQAGPAGGAIDPKTVDFYAAQSIAGDNSWQVGLARGKVGQALISAVKDRIPQMAAELGLTPQDVGTNKATAMGLTTAIRERQKFLGAAGQFVRNFEAQIDLVEKYTEKGAADLNQALNKWIQNGRVALQNDPTDVVRLDTAIRGAAREHQRIVTGVTSNAQLHVAAQETADQLLNRAQTPAAIKAALGVMREEAKNAIKAGEQEVAQLQRQMRSLGTRGGAPTGGSSNPPATNAKGWKLMTDAQGNRAYVGPNNEIEEVR